jgi:hypothetical protein
MSLQSTATLATSPLHDSSGDRSSLEETPRSPAFRLLMRLSFRPRLAISRSLCCALHSTPPLRGRLVPVEDRLLRERRLGRNEVGTLQLQQQKGKEVSQSKRPPRRSTSQKKHRTNKMHREDGDSQISQSPREGASGAAASAATSRSTSRSPAPRGAGPQGATGGSERSRSPSRGLVGRHLAEPERPPAERHNSSGMVLPENF